MKRSTVVGVTTLILSLTGTAMAQQGLYFSEDGNTNGLYFLDINTAAATHLGASGVTSETVGLAPSASILELWGSTPWETRHVATDGSGATPVGNAAAEALAYDSVTGTLYGMINTSFFTIDTTTGNQDTSLPNPTGLDFEGLAYDEGRDVLWAIPGFADVDTHVWYYTPDDQVWHQSYDTGIDWYEGALAYNPFDDVLYAKNDPDSNLYKIDLGTGLTSIIGDTGILQGGGLAYVVPEPASLSLLVLGGLLVTRRRR